MRNIVCWTLPGFLVCFGFSSAFAAPVLPQKAFEVEGGIVAVEAGVIPDLQRQMPFGKLKYPTRYVIHLVNESPYPLWFDSAWIFPEKKKGKASGPKSIQGDKTPPKGSYWFYYTTFSVIADQAIGIEIRAYSDTNRSNVVGSQRAELYFDQASVDSFLADFPQPFKSGPMDGNYVVVLSGWHDIPDPRTDVPGTMADAELQRDIQLAIWKQDSIRNWSCEREALSAEVIDAVESQIVSSLSADARERAMLEQFDDKLITEKWWVRSCGQTLSYEVLLSTSPNGGTDLMVLDTTDSAGSGPDAPESGAGYSVAEPDVPAEPTLTADQAVDETSF